MGKLKREILIDKKLRTCTLNWNGEGFDPKEYDIAGKSVYNSEGLLYCPKCGRFLNDDAFFPKRDGSPKAPCKECCRDYQRELKSNPENKKTATIKRLVKKDLKELAEIIKNVPLRYFDNKFDMKRVNPEDIPEHLRSTARRLGVGSLYGTEDAPKKRGRKKGQKVGPYKKRKPRIPKSMVRGKNDRVILKGYGVLKAKAPTEIDLSDGIDCPVCDTLKPMSAFRNPYTYCCAECEGRIRNEMTDSTKCKTVLFVRDRKETIELLDKFEETSMRMKDASDNCEYENYIQLRRELDLLRVKIDASVNWKSGNHADVYSIS